MGMLKGLLKGAIAQKLISEARKPENQRKAKELFAQLRSKQGRNPRR